MRKGQKKYTGRGIGAFYGPDPKIQLKIETEFRDRIVKRAAEIGVPPPEYMRYCILKELEG